MQDLRKQQIMEDQIREEIIRKKIKEEERQKRKDAERQKKKDEERRIRKEEERRIRKEEERRRQKEKEREREMYYSNSQRRIENPPQKSNNENVMTAMLLLMQELNKFELQILRDEVDKRLTRL